MAATGTLPSIEEHQNVSSSKKEFKSIFQTDKNSKFFRHDAKKADAEIEIFEGKKPNEKNDLLNDDNSKEDQRESLKQDCSGDIIDLPIKNSASS